MQVKRSDRLILIIAMFFTVAYFVLAIFIVTLENGHITSTFENDLNNVGNLIANNQTLVSKLSNGDITLNSDVDEFYDIVDEISFIVVVDMDFIVFAHPDEGELGEEYLFINEASVFNGVTSTTKSIGPLGESTHINIPIFEGNQQIGAVSVGIFSENVYIVKAKTTTTLVLAFGFGFVVSIIGLLWLSKKYKSDLFGFSTKEIAMLYAENKSVIEQLDEGILSIDKNYIITTINPALQKMFGLNENDYGKNVQDIFKHVDFKEIINNDLHIANKYRKIDDLKLLMNAFPLYLDNEIIGATAIFRSHLEVDTLVDQISGYQQIAIALRSQKHEFQNKLHVVLGLIKMKDYLKAENYIMENVYTTNLASDYYTSRIKDDRIIALFVGKEIQSKEYNASLLLTSDSYITKSHNPVNSDDIVLILGNLIDNSFEAYINKDMEDKKIVVDIFEDDEQIKITVIDQAGGINPEVIDKMFERGVSTKNGDSRGTGLRLVNEIVTVYNGVKNVTSSTEETKIEIILMKVII